MKKLYSLIDKIYRRENLYEAFKAVKRNQGAPGVDGETVTDFADEVDANIERLHVELKTNTYVPSPVRRVEIPKADGGTRPLGIPTVRDRVEQQAFVNVVEPYFDQDFHPSSYGYRKGRSQHQAVAKARMFMKNYGLEKMNVTLWKNSNVHIIHQLMPNAYFSELGLMDMCRHEVGLLSSNKVAW